jgi:xanthine dehydrogenase YagT iron-sulfur-binding subunit
MRQFALVALGLTVNGRALRCMVRPSASLLDVLREQLGLTAAKRGCDQGACGACTVLVDERRINACLALALSLAGRDIETLEGLAGETLHPLQSAFITHDALQCGYCTPGQIMSARGLLAEGGPHERAAIAERMSGNLCRCGAYANIVDAIIDVAGR